MGRGSELTRSSYSPALGRRVGVPGSRPRSAIGILRSSQGARRHTPSDHGPAPAAKANYQNRVALLRCAVTGLRGPGQRS